MSTAAESSLVSRQAPAPEAPIVSVVIPCLDEAATIALCVRSALRTISEHGLSGEVIVVDNGSGDDSAVSAERAGARVIDEPQKGYGCACRAGLRAATGRFVLMADADLSYDFAEIPRFVAELERGADVVIGDRMRDIKPGAMPWLHRYIGNPLLTGLLNLLFRTGVRDAHCGMRALSSEALEALDLRSTGMEFASEMIIRAAQGSLAIHQLRIVYHPREGESKLSAFRDGARHVRLLLCCALTSRG